MLDTIDKKLLDYIAQKTNSPLDTQIEFFNENVEKSPKEMILCIRSLAEATVEYLYCYVSGKNSIPGPYWCLVFKGKQFERFVKACDKSKRKGYSYPKDYKKMWEAHVVLKQSVPNTFITEANRIRTLGNMAAHNSPNLAGKDLPREAKALLDSYEYLLDVVNRVVSQGHTGKGDTFNVLKWFAGLQAALAKERAKTQEDYDDEMF